MNRINEIMKRYALRREGDKLCCMPLFHGDIPAEEADYIRNHKQELLAAVDERQHQREEQINAYRRKLDAIEGLNEIEEARRDLERWHYEWEESFSGDCGGLGVRQKPNYDFAAMYAKYPKAAAYLKARDYSSASNPAKAAAGNAAAEAILNGEDYEQAIQQMEQEWQAYAEAHVWD